MHACSLGLLGSIACCIRLHAPCWRHTLSAARPEHLFRLSSLPCPAPPACRSTGISLYYQMSEESLKGFESNRKGNDFLVNLIDSPGEYRQAARQSVARQPHRRAATLHLRMRVPRPHRGAVAPAGVCRIRTSLLYSALKLTFAALFTLSSAPLSLPAVQATSTSPLRSLLPCASLTVPWWWLTALRACACRPRPCCARCACMLFAPVETLLRSLMAVVGWKFGAWPAPAPACAACPRSPIPWAHLPTRHPHHLPARPARRPWASASAPS